MNPLKLIFHSRDKPKNYLSSSFYSFFFGGTSSGKPVNETTAMQMTAVYSCVRILSEAVAGLPLNVYHYNDSGGKYNIREITYDRWNATHLVQNLEGMGFTVVPFG